METFAISVFLIFIQWTSFCPIFRSAKLFTKAESSEEDIDDIINDIFDESSFAKKPVVSRYQKQCWREGLNHNIFRWKTKKSEILRRGGSLLWCEKEGRPVELGSSDQMWTA